MGLILMEQLEEVAGSRRGRLPRAMAAPPAIHGGGGPRRSNAGCLRLTSEASTGLRRASLKVSGRSPAFPPRFPAPSSAWALGLPPAARLPLGPLGRRKPAARTLRSPAASVMALPLPPWRGPALGSASSSRLRVWPLPPVLGERQTLTNP